MTTLLLIEQDSSVSEQLKTVAQHSGYTVICASNADEAALKIKRSSPAVILANKELIYHHTRLFAIAPHHQSIWLVFSQSWPNAVREQFQQLRCQILPLEHDKINEALRASAAPAPDQSSCVLASLCGESPAMRKLKDQIRKMARTPLSVFLIGDTGTGKELIAQAIHRLSPRRDKPFIAINCGAIPETLIESEFFGHEKGAFTGAEQQRLGVFELCGDGTLFLDEVTEMDAALQVRLLRVLETGEFYRVGGSEKHQTKARVIAATNLHPKQAIDQAKLRKDLYYRLCVLPMYVPALADRQEDIALLAQHFLNQLSEEFGSQKSLSDEALHYLQHKAWPGNIRQLRNELSRAYVLSDSQTIEKGLLTDIPSIE